MIPSIIYGRPLSVWLLYFKLPILFGYRLYIINLNEVDVRPKETFRRFLLNSTGFPWLKGVRFEQ